MIVLHHLEFKLCQYNKLRNNGKHTKQRNCDSGPSIPTEQNTDAGKSPPFLTEAPLKHSPLGCGRGCLLLYAAIFSSNLRCPKQLLQHIFGNNVASMSNWLEFTFPFLGILYPAFLTALHSGQISPYFLLILKHE